MADNKQYITQKQEKGALLISEDVIATIITHAASEVDGIVCLTSRSGSELGDIISKKNRGRGIRVTVGQNDEVTIDCNIIVAYGNSVVSVSSALQNAVIGAVDSMTGIKINTVNVNVCGIVRKQG